MLCAAACTQAMLRWAASWGPCAAADVGRCGLRARSRAVRAPDVARKWVADFLHSHSHIHSIMHPNVVCEGVLRPPEVPHAGSGCFWVWVVCTRGRRTVCAQMRDRKCSRKHRKLTKFGGARRDAGAYALFTTLIGPDGWSAHRCGGWRRISLAAAWSSRHAGATEQNVGRTRRVTRGRFWVGARLSDDRGRTDGEFARKMWPMGGLVPLTFAIRSGPKKMSAAEVSCGRVCVARSVLVASSNQKERSHSLRS